VDPQRKSLPIKEWKVLDTFFIAKKPIREGLDLELVIEKECPVFEGRQENFDGDPKVSVRMTRGNLKLRLSWAEASIFADLIREAQAACTDKVQAVEEECAKRRAERAQKRADREMEASSDDEGPRGNDRKGFRRTGKTERDRAKRKGKTENAGNA
jgi:hypothetical protein